MLIPKLLPIPFAENGRKNEIPLDRDSSMAGQLASLNTGFPPITMQRKEDGGLPPDGMDFNGIFFESTSHISFMNKGGFYKFNSDFADEIGGYSKGAILLSDDENYLMISVEDANKDNFNDEESDKWNILAIVNIDLLLNDKVSSNTLADALNLKLDKTTYATLIQRGITQLTNTIDGSEDKSATPKAVNTVKVKADQVPNPIANNFLVGNTTTAYKLMTVIQVQSLLSIPTSTVNELNKKVELGAEQLTATVDGGANSNFGSNMASALTLVPPNCVITAAHSVDARVALVKYRPIIKGI